MGMKTVRRTELSPCLGVSLHDDQNPASAPRQPPTLSKFRRPGDHVGGNPNRGLGPGACRRVQHWLSDIIGTELGPFPGAGQPDARPHRHIRTKSHLHAFIVFRGPSLHDTIVTLREPRPHSALRADLPPRDRDRRRPLSANTASTLSASPLAMRDGSFHAATACEERHSCRKDCASR
jgi:hypothetical protein